MRQTLYNVVATIWPHHQHKSVQLVQFDLAPDGKQDFLRCFLSIMRRFHVYGGAFSLFDRQGIYAHAIYGDAHRGIPVTEDTFFRVASISKMITAAAVSKMNEQGVVDIDEDVSDLLPVAVKTGLPITLRTLMSHRAGFCDGESYLSLVGTGADLAKLLNQDNIRIDYQKNEWEYSNFGAGLIASVLEKKTNTSFECLMQQYLFEPLDMTASFYPQHIKGDLADAYHVLPPKKAPAFDAVQRKNKDDAGWDKADPLHHYSMAQGNCCIDITGATLIGQSLMTPGFLTQNTLEDMRKPLGSFGRRDWRLRQGMGLFVLDDPSVASCTLYGHQGLAYGAVHGIFFDPERQNGMVFLSSGASLKRSGVMTGVNLELMRMWQHWQKSS